MFYAIRKWGIKEVLRQMYVHSWFRGGDLVGVDRVGNRYYQVTDVRYFQHGKDRYVEYGERGRMEASRIPPHWHGWLHHTYTETPVEEDADGCLGVYRENLTGSSEAYQAKSTVKKDLLSKF